MSVAMPKAMFFDWDGTLVDSFSFLHKTHNHVRGIFGMGGFTLDEFRGYFGQPREKLYAEIYGAERIEEAKGHFEAFVVANHHEIQPIKGARDVLETLAALGVPMGIVTNKKGTLVRKEIENHRWSDFFVSVVGAGEASADKPSAAPLFLAIEKSGLDIAPKDIWYVGDTQTDLACAKEAGAPCVFIEDLKAHQGLIEEYKPALIFDNCENFAAFLLQTNPKSLQQA